MRRAASLPRFGGMQTFIDSIAALATQPRAVAVGLLVIAAAVCDWRSRRIPNMLTGSAAALGVALAIAGAGGGPSAMSSLAGAVLGFALMLPLYARGAMGAGDVKLMTAVGAFVGLQHVAFAVLFTFMAGGVLAIAAAAWLHALPHLAGTVRATVMASLTGAPADETPSVGRMPYALAILAGTVACVLLRQPFLA